ncbi:hypothetical protein [Rhodoferax sp.]|nr:hypothetical protein [Rhodoferax sp.]
MRRARDAHQLTLCRVIHWFHHFSTAPYGPVNDLAQGGVGSRMDELG